MEKSSVEMHIWFALIKLRALQCFLVPLLLILGLSPWTCYFRSSGGTLNEIGQVKMTRGNVFYYPLELKKKSDRGMRWMKEMSIKHQAEDGYKNIVWLFWWNKSVIKRTFDTSWLFYLIIPLTKSVWNNI